MVASIRKLILSNRNEVWLLSDSMLRSVNRMPWCRMKATGILRALPARSSKKLECRLISPELSTWKRELTSKSVAAGNGNLLQLALHQGLDHFLAAEHVFDFVELHGVDST